MQRGRKQHEMKNENISFFDEMLNALVVELKEELGIAMFKRHGDGCESEDEASLRTGKVHRIIEEVRGVEELKDIKKI